MKLRNLLKWNKIKKWVKTTLIVALVGGTAVALNNTFNDDGVGVIKTKTFELNEIEFTEIEELSVVFGSPETLSNTYFAIVDDYLIVAEDLTSYNDEFEFKFGSKLSTNTYSQITIFSRNKILDISVDNYENLGNQYFLTNVGDRYTTTPSSTDLSLASTIKNHVDFELTTLVGADKSEYYDYSYASFSLESQEYNNRVINEIKLLVK